MNDLHRRFMFLVSLLVLGLKYLHLKGIDTKFYNKTKTEKHDKQKHQSRKQTKKKKKNVQLLIEKLSYYIFQTNLSKIFQVFLVANTLVSECKFKMFSATFQTKSFSA